VFVGKISSLDSLEILDKDNLQFRSTRISDKIVFLVLVPSKRSHTFIFTNGEGRRKVEIIIH
jgi:hypothetical protein